MKIAIFASGTGSNFEAIADDQALKAAGLEIEILVCDRPNAAVIEKAQRRGIPTFIIRPKDFENRSHYEQAIVNALAKFQIDLILLAGYMRVITTTLLSEYPMKIINIHPALLPLFPGIHGIDDAYNAGVKETGVTIHYIDEGVDTGPIIAQQSVPILSNETLEQLEAKIHEVEHQLYPNVILNLLNNDKKGDQ
ncbi:phosphoribosylglycinamide formyltransferase [Dellaglioa sp. L3N]